ncbi:unnamed protein product [Penicillium bialowiezense]
MAANLSYPTFCAADDTISISLYQTNDSRSDNLASFVFTENSMFETHVSATPIPKFRIISIHSKSSPKPLQISRAALQVLIDRYEIGDEIWDLTSTFGDKPVSSSVGEGAMKVQNRENRAQVKLNCWTMRQMAVFHHHDFDDLQHLWIFFQVSSNTPVQKDIDSYVSLYRQEMGSDHAWFALHSSVFASYLKNWHDYVQFLGRDVDGHIFCQTDKSLDFIMRNIDHYLSAGGDSNLTAIHSTRDRLLPTTYRLGVILETLTRLITLSNSLASQKDGATEGYVKLGTFLAYHKDRLEGLVVGVEILKEKIKDILNMPLGPVADHMETTLGLNYRMTSQILDLNNRMVELNNRMLYSNEQLLRLGTRNFDDNATVKVVTILTLVYLPASLVSSVFGMNLFKFDDGTTEELRISKQFWIFIVATIILAIITISIWYVWTHKERITRRKSHGTRPEEFSKSPTVTEER